GKAVRIDQINTVDVNDVLKRKADLLKAMEEEAKAEGYDLFLVIATNVLDSNSEAIVYGEPKDAVEKAFNQTISDDTIALPGVVSRKKQVVPQLTDVLD
ncbi:MAG: manganese-dependent inorganic pyrophosphatase, partial [Apilactobacillus sp.]|nr:manganese-dependent inorganic pyrophosphatase [Apilactobacillus sp.]